MSRAPKRAGASLIPTALSDDRFLRWNLLNRVHFENHGYVGPNYEMRPFAAPSELPDYGFQSRRSL